MLQKKNEYSEFSLFLSSEIHAQIVKTKMRFYAKASHIPLVRTAQELYLDVTKMIQHSDLRVKQAKIILFAEIPRRIQTLSDMCAEDQVELNVGPNEEIGGSLLDCLHVKHDAHLHVSYYAPESLEKPVLQRT